MGVNYEKLAEIGELEGLKIWTVNDLSVLEQSARALSDWQKNGYAGEMGYMMREPDLLADPARLFPTARSAIVFSAAYSQAKRSTLTKGHGRVARYAWGSDYHLVLKERATRFVKQVEMVLGQSINFRYASDAVPLLERAFAERAAGGFIGKNSMLIRPGEGSLFFLGEILWDIEIEGKSVPAKGGSCGTCTSCITNCPTKAIVSERVVDSRRCISYLTIEKRGSFSLWEREAIGEWIFGCDVCQEICPFNHTPLKIGRRGSLPEFKAESGTGGALDLAEVLSLRSPEMFKKRFIGTPVLRARREGLLRNAAVVAANTLSEGVWLALVETATEDPSAIVRQHALWALFVLEEKCNIEGRKAIRSRLEKATVENDLNVSNEAHHLLELLN